MEELMIDSVYVVYNFIYFYILIRKNGISLLNFKNYTLETIELKINIFKKIPR